MPATGAGRRHRDRAGRGLDAAMATLVRSVMLGMERCAVMMKQGSGSIINNAAAARAPLLDLE